MKGPQSNTFFYFFLDLLLRNLTTPEISFDWGALFAVLNVSPYMCKSSFTNCCWVWSKIWVITLPKETSLRYESSTPTSQELNSSICQSCESGSVTFNQISPFLSDPGPIIVYACQSLTDWLTDSLTTLLKMNECITFADGIKYLSDVDIEMKLRFSCQQLVTTGKAGKAGNSCNSCQSWRQWIDLCWWNQISKRCWYWNEIEV